MPSTGLGTEDIMIKKKNTSVPNLIELLMWWGRQTVKQIYIIMTLCQVDNLLHSSRV